MINPVQALRAKVGGLWRQPGRAAATESRFRSATIAKRSLQPLPARSISGWSSAWRPVDDDHIASTVSSISWLYYWPSAAAKLSLPARIA